MACQADLDAQAAQDAAATGQPQAAGYPDLDEEDDAAMQQALILSRQHDMSQGSDPQAASSAGTAPTTEQELQTGTPTWAGVSIRSSDPADENAKGTP